MWTPSLTSADTPTESTPNNSAMTKTHKAHSSAGPRIGMAAVCFLFLALLAAAAVSVSGGSGKYYVSDGSIVAVSPPLDEKSVLRATDRFAYLHDTWLAPNDMHIFVAVVPDKSYYMPDKKGRGQMDYAAMYDMVYGAMDYASPIHIADCLDKDAYYSTDSHWRQECLLPVAERITDAMLHGTDTGSSGAFAAAAYETKTAADSFTGSYADAVTEAAAWEKKQFSQVKPDTIFYLTNEILEQASVYIYDTGTTSGIYSEEKLHSRNPYDFFLSGPVALMRIENPAAETDRKLIAFRDSYGSSLLPLLVPFYREILVADIRYTMSGRLGEFVDFASYRGADALFLYSTTLLNRSISLR